MIIGIETDIIEIERIKSYPKETKVRERIFTPQELEYCSTKGDTLPH